MFKCTYKQTVRWDLGPKAMFTCVSFVVINTVGVCVVAMYAGYEIFKADSMYSCQVHHHLGGCHHKHIACHCC